MRWSAFAVHTAITASILTTACNQQDSRLRERIASLEARVEKLEAARSRTTQSTSTPSPPPVQAGLMPARQTSDETWHIVNVASRVTESNDSWWKYAWQLTIRNDSSQPQLFDATIEFKDKDGFVVDDDTEYKLLVPPASEQTFTGYDLVNANVAGNVTSTSAKVKQRS